MGYLLAVNVLCPDLAKKKIHKNNFFSGLVLVASRIVPFMHTHHVGYEFSHFNNRMSIKFPSLIVLGVVKHSILLNN